MAALTAQNDDFPQWYQDVVAKAELADHGPVRGTMVIRPYGWGIWEKMQSHMDNLIKEQEVDNCYFPLFIPKSYLEKEADHVAGFAPELAVVTHGGGKELEEPVVVRPTSETVIGTFMSKWIDSYRDLPLKLNQWANVVRWELRTRLFLRTSEFLWQEGHTAHANQQEAAEFALLIHNQVYQKFFEQTTAIPVLAGIKSPGERFAGAINSLTCEAMMRDGKALQIATSHELGQNFSRSFDIQFLSAQGGHEHAWTTSWGTSTRMLGGLIMCHGDDYGLRLPPALAPIQVIIIPIKEDDQASRAITDRLLSELRAKNIRTKVSDRPGWSFGRRTTDAEIKGIPLRIVLGPRDLAENKVTIVQRSDNEKKLVSLDTLVDSVPGLLNTIHQELFTQAQKRLSDNTHIVTSVSEAIDAAQNGFAQLPWGVARQAQHQFDEHAISVRLLQTADRQTPSSAEVNPENPSDDLIATVAKAY